MKYIITILVLNNRFCKQFQLIIVRYAQHEIFNETLKKISLLQNWFYCFTVSNIQFIFGFFILTLIHILKFLRFLDELRFFYLLKILLFIGKAHYRTLSQLWEKILIYVHWILNHRQKSYKGFTKIFPNIDVIPQKIIFIHNKSYKFNIFWKFGFSLSIYWKNMTTDIQINKRSF